MSLMTHNKHHTSAKACCEVAVAFHHEKTKKIINKNKNKHHTSAKACFVVEVASSHDVCSGAKGSLPWKTDTYQR